MNKFCQSHAVRNNPVWLYSKILVGEPHQFQNRNFIYLCRIEHKEDWVEICVY
jgi:hypothetical protein